MSDPIMPKDGGAAGDFPVVGIGASAGGLDAFKRFLPTVPESSGMAYVFVQHSSAGHESILPAILRPFSKIPIVEIHSEVKPEPNHLYLIPAGYMLTATDGVLRVELPHEERTRVKIIDHFFSTLAIVHQSFAVGIILSGTMNDGTLGLGMIRAGGGITFAQDSGSAAETAMPENAVRAGAVDFVMPPEEMFAKIQVVNRRFPAPGFAPPAETNVDADEALFKSILAILRTRRGVDFNYYKQPTLKRRIARRISLSHSENISDYLDLLRESKTELEALYNDLLISVTGFFRDKKTFDYIAGHVVPALLSQRKSGEPVRIWTAGCATGEEAYSLAICLMEALGEQITSVKVQIFATDISERAIAKARIGIYRKDELESVSPGRLAQFFTKLDGDFQVNKSVRELCVFAQHNFLKDPPFSRIDMITCRNVLIYLEPVLQKKAIVTFHYALNENGMLILGKSETIGGNTDLFKVVPGEEKLYARTGPAGRFMHVTSARREERYLRAEQTGQGEVRTAADIFKKADDAILQKYAAPGVLVNDQYDVVQFRGETESWIVPAAGKASFNLLRMAREGLAFELRNLLHLARQKNVAMKKGGIQIKIGDKETYAAIEVFPLLDLPEAHFLILFSHDEVASTDYGSLQLSGLKQGQDARDLRIKQLETQLLQTREDMRGVTEEQEAANEELQSANEELLSGSEELQTVNEELETSKEELQSTNEELTIVNHELLDRNEQLNSARRYSDTVVRTIRDPLLVMDRNMIVKTATEGFYRAFDLDENRVEGKNLFEINTPRFRFDQFRDLLEKELPEKGEVVDYEVTYDFGLGRRQLMQNARIEKINGQDLVLLAIEDITDRRKVEELVSALEKQNANLEYSNQELEQFAHVASHDLQEPLRKIMTFSQFLEEKIQDGAPEIKQYLPRIIQAAKRMERLIKDLLTFSQVGNLSVDVAHVDLNLIFKEILEDYDTVLLEKEIQVTVRDLPLIHGIGLHMRQLFANLVSNAIKFASKDRPSTLIIRSEPVDAETVRTHPLLKKNLTYHDISVEDNGVGFDEEFSEKIFVIFQRLHSHTAVPGSGIGLALCRRIVHHHNGEIYARSKENEGSVFHVILPVVS